MHAGEFDKHSSELQRTAYQLCDLGQASIASLSLSYLICEMEIIATPLPVLL